MKYKIFFIKYLRKNINKIRLMQIIFQIIVGSDYFNFAPPFGLKKFYSDINSNINLYQP